MYKDIMREISLEYERKRDRLEKEKKARIEYIYKKVPAIRKIGRAHV